MSDADVETLIIGAGQAGQAPGKPVRVRARQDVRSAGHDVPSEIQAVARTVLLGRHEVRHSAWGHAGDTRALPGVRGRLVIPWPVTSSS
jgi:hypothetical protein